MGHGLHAYLARDQGIFHQTTPLTLAETASVFGETVTFGRLLDETSDPEAAPRAARRESLEGQIATVFRQVAMNRFEDRVHTQRRDEGELSIDQFNEAWADTQYAMLGDSVEITEGYRTWWSYIPHFMGTPGYVYAYAYGQLLALSVYRAYEQQGADFVPRYLEMLASGWVAFTRGARRDRRARSRRPRVLGRWARDRRRAARGRRSGGNARRVGCKPLELGRVHLECPDARARPCPRAPRADGSRGATSTSRDGNVSSRSSAALLSSIATLGHRVERLPGGAVERPPVASVTPRRVPPAASRIAPPPTLESCASRTS